jgi:hypothetical protein
MKVNLLLDFQDHLIFVDDFIFELLDPLVFEFVDLGFGPLRNLFGPGRFFERPLLPQPKPWGRKGAKRGKELGFRVQTSNFRLQVTGGTAKQPNSQ